MASARLAAAQGKRDDVFFFILIDFLVQILFFGLFVFVVYQTAQKLERQKAKDAVDAAGVSDLTELTDDLTRLAPVKLREVRTMIDQAGGARELKVLLERVKQEGGATASIARLDKLRRLEGRDKPSCLIDGATREPRPLMTVLAQDSSITVVESGPELQKLLGGLNLSLDSVRSSSPSSFLRAFQPLLSQQPNCRYYIKFNERTALVAPRKAAGQVFYLMVR